MLILKRGIENVNDHATNSDFCEARSEFRYEMKENIEFFEIVEIVLSSILVLHN